MAKIKKFDVMVVPLEVEANFPGWVFLFLAWFTLVRFMKFNFVLGNRTICSVYRLVVPRFLKDGGDHEE